MSTTEATTTTKLTTLLTPTPFTTDEPIITTGTVPTTTTTTTTPTIPTTTEITTNNYTSDTTSPSNVTTMYPAEKTNEQDGGPGIMIGGAVGGVVVVCIIVIVAVIIYRRIKKRPSSGELSILPAKTTLDAIDLKQREGLMVAPDQQANYSSKREQQVEQSMYSNLDSEGKPTDTTNPELDPDGYLKKSTKQTKDEQTIHDSEDTNKQLIYENVDNSLQNPKPKRAKKGDNKKDTLAVHSAMTTDDKHTNSSPVIGYVKGRLAESQSKTEHPREVELSDNSAQVEHVDETKGELHKDYENTGSNSKNKAIINANGSELASTDSNDKGYINTRDNDPLHTDVRSIYENVAAGTNKSLVQNDATAQEDELYENP